MSTSRSAADRLDCDRVAMDYFVTAPCRIVVAETVAASPERIFEVFCDATSWTRWAFPITGVEWTSPFPLEVGATRTVHMRGGMVGWEEFIAWEPFRRMAFRFDQTIPGGPTAFAEDYVVTLSGASARTLPLTRAAMNRMNAHMLRQFRRYVESAPVLSAEASEALGPV